MSQTYSTYYKYKEGSSGGVGGGGVSNSPNSTSTDLEDYFSTPADSNEWHRVGAIDTGDAENPGTGLYRLPTLSLIHI